MSFPEFGELVSEAPKNFPQFGTPIEEPSRIKSLLSAPAKGAVKEFADIAETLQRLPIPKGPFKPEQARKFAEEKFVTQPKEPEKFLERTGRVATGAVLSPGGIVAKGFQTLGGAALGYAAEKLGAPDWAQAIAESLPFFFSGGKKIPLKPEQRRLGDFLRKQGLTENEITPLLKTPEQIERWSKLASKGKKSRELMESVYQKTGHIYDSITEQASKLKNPYMSPEVSKNFLNELTNLTKDMPHKYRSLIKQDALDLIREGGSFNGLKNFYTDVNAVIGGEHGGRAIVGRFKPAISKAMESIDPKLADDFKLATDLYRTRANVASKILNKKQVEEMLDLGETLGLGSAIFNRDLGLMGKILGVAGGRKLAREMLINPRLQNLSVRVGEALAKNKLTLAEKLMTQFKKEVEKEDPELANSFPSQ